MLSQFGSTSRTDDEYLVSGQFPVVGRRRETRRFEMLPAGFLACVNDRPARRRFPGRDVADDVPHQGLGGRVVLSAAGDVGLAEQHHAFAFPILHQGGILQGVTAVEDGQEVARCRFLDQRRGDVAPVAATPAPLDLQSAPLDGGGVGKSVRKAWGKDCRIPAPVPEVLVGDAGQQWVVRHALEDPAQPVLGNAETEALLEHIPGLLEDDDLHTLAHARDVRSRPVECQGALADDKHIVGAQLCVRLAHPVERNA